MTVKSAWGGNEHGKGQTTRIERQLPDSVDLASAKPSVDFAEALHMGRSPIPMGGKPQYSAGYAQGKRNYFETFLKKEPPLTITFNGSKTITEPNKNPMGYLAKRLGR
jgi:hypothetical protein